MTIHNRNTQKKTQDKIRYEKTYFGSRPYDGGNDVCSRNETNAMVQ